VRNKRENKYQGDKNLFEFINLRLLELLDMRFHQNELNKSEFNIISATNITT